MGTENIVNFLHSLYITAINSSSFNGISYWIQTTTITPVPFSLKTKGLWKQDGVNRDTLFAWSFWIPPLVGWSHFNHSSAKLSSNRGRRYKVTYKRIRTHF